MRSLAIDGRLYECIPVGRPIFDYVFITKAVCFRIFPISPMAVANVRLDTRTGRESNVSVRFPKRSRVHETEPAECELRNIIIGQCRVHRSRHVCSFIERKETHFQCDFRVAGEISELARGCGHGERFPAKTKHLRRFRTRFFEIAPRTCAATM